ncbi:MAG: sugar ABC transporter permease [Burkholderiales bacterium]|nr:sugar ABC transporter permease [Burkholderiales bacterium]MDE1926543.1 sugar ABC transporter permease [Burkholderiales bacterium]MDE2160061.1 sugar ABC transporter permease [Burkholderiales bacterium]MDE2505487.1 sugar ABC transporter permease [Burkholderiales bacterium]
MKLPAALRLSPAFAPYALLAPFFGLFFVFGLFPIGFSLYLSFHTWDPTAGLSAMHFVGLGNFAFALRDDWFWKSLRNTAWLAAASGIPQHLVAIPLAVFLHTHFKRLRNLAVGAYFLPYITSTVAIAIMFSALFSTDYGLVNQGLHGAFGSAPVDWLGTPEYLKPVLALIVFWRYLGFNVVLYLAALQTIPRDLYEAAAMDGAGRLQQFLHITLPSLRPMIFFGVTLSVIGGLQLFEEPFILTNGRGGSDQAGMTTALYLYRMAFDFNDFGAASAMSWLLFIVVVALTWLTNRAFRPRT